MRVRLYLILLLMFFSLMLSAHSVVEWDDYFEVEHSWKCNGKQCSITLNISKSLYDYYRNEREHLVYHYQFEDGNVPPHFFGFMVSEHDRSLMRSIVNEFTKGAISDIEKSKMALAFVQSLPYAFDSESKGVEEYVRYPVETLVDGCGDCEDKVALLAAILYEMDVDFILLVLPDHMAVGLHCDGVEADRYLLFQGKKYYYLETTMPNWKIGQIPEDYKSSAMEAVPVDDTPKILIKGVQFESQSAHAFEKANCRLQIDMHNLGPGKVTQIKLHVRLIEKGKKQRVLTEESYLLRDLQEGELRTELLSLKSLIKENSVLEVELTGAETVTQYYELGLNYRKTRRY